MPEPVDPAIASRLVGDLLRVRSRCVGAWPGNPQWREQARTIFAVIDALVRDARYWASTACDPWHRWQQVSV